MIDTEQQQPIRVNDLDEIARRLRALTRRYDDFFKLQFQRLAKHMGVQKEMLGQADVVREMLDNLQREKQKWESERLAELERMQLASDKLIAAWNELESRHRQSLASKNESHSKFDTRNQQTEVDRTAAASSNHSPVTLGNAFAPPANSFGGVPSVSAPTPIENPATASFAASSTAIDTVSGPVEGQVNHPVQRAVEPTAPRPKSDSERFEYEQLKRQMKQHANRQG